MKKALIFCLIFMSSVPGFCQRLSKADYLADLQYLKDTLPKRHINLYAKIPKADFDKKIDEIGSRLSNPDNETFTVELFKLVVAIGDEHTHIEPVFTKIAPVRFSKFTEGIYVTATDGANADILLYRLTGINGHPIADVISRFKEIIQSENPSFFDSRFLHFINNPAMLKGLQLNGSIDKISFDLAGPNGKTIKRVVKSVNGNDAANLTLVTKNKLPSQKAKGNYWYTYHPQSGTLYFNYNNCQEQDGRPFAKFNDSLFNIIDKNKPKRLIVDLRDNDGGNSGVLTPFTE